MSEPTGEFLTYQKFNDQTIAADLAQLFDENDIPFQLEDSSLQFDASFAFNEISKEFRVKIKAEDFSKADQLLQQYALSTVQEIDVDHYLYQFSDEELIDILAKPDEWNVVDVALAQKILKERGKEISNDNIEILKSERLETLAKPASGHFWWIVIGYLSSALGGFLGITIGAILYFHKKTLPNGTREFGFNLNARNHGFFMMILGGMVFCITILYKIFHVN